MAAPGRGRLPAGSDVPLLLATGSRCSVFGLPAFIYYARINYRWGR